MSLLFESRRVGHVTVVTCSGRMIAGTNTAALQQYLDELLPLNPRVVLHLGGIEFIDSSGLGLLVRYLTRAHNAGGTMRLRADSSPITPSTIPMMAIHLGNRRRTSAGTETPAQRRPRGTLYPGPPVAKIRW